LVGGVYAANTVGAVAGALAASLILTAWIGSQHAQQVMMVLSASAAVLLLWPRSTERSPPPSQSRAAGVVALPGAFATTVWLVRAVPPVPGLLVAHGRFAATFI